MFACCLVRPAGLPQCAALISLRWAQLSPQGTAPCPRQMPEAPVNKITFQTLPAQSFPDVCCNSDKAALYDLLQVWKVADHQHKIPQSIRSCIKQGCSYLPKGAEILLLHVLQMCLCQQEWLLMDSQQQCRIGAEAFPAFGGNIDGLCVLLSQQTLLIAITPAGSTIEK